MTQATDVIIADAGYMLVPGSYTRAQDGMPEGRTGRIAFTDFFGGMGRPLQLERDRAYAGVAVGPALFGQGVQPWAYRSGGAAMTMDVAPDKDVRVPSVIVDGRLYFSTGSEIFRAVASGFTWSTPTMQLDTVELIEDMCLYSSNGMLCTFGSAKDVTWYRASDWAATVLLAGEQGHAVAGYGGYAIWNDARTAGRPTFLRQVTGTEVDLRVLDYDVRRLVNADARCYAITDSALYSYSGRVHEATVTNPAYDGPGDTDPNTIEVQEWSGDWTPFFQNGVQCEEDDFRVFEGFGGRIYAWVAGGMMEFNPNGDRAGWRDTGLHGLGCRGSCVAAGYLIVSIVTKDNTSELWAWDGSGWWCLAAKASSVTGNWIWPLNLNNAGQFDLLVFHDGLKTYDLFRLQHRAATIHAYPTQGPSSSLVTPMIDAGERDKTKAWRKVGAVFASPERFGNLSSTDAVTVTLAYSIDGGGTWTNADSQTVIGNSAGNNNFTLDAQLSAAESRFLMLRVTWSSVSDWAPILVGVWSEFEVMDSPSRRRKWTFDVKAADQTIDREGSTLSRTGRQLIAELWSAWESGTTLVLKDIDYDAAPVPREVRIVGIAEHAPKPSDHGRWGDSIVKLQMVEI